MGLTFETIGGQERCDSVISFEDYNTNQPVVSKHMAFEELFGTYELGQYIFGLLSARDLLNAQLTCTAFDTHVRTLKDRFTPSDSINRMIANGRTKYMQLNFLTSILCPLTDLMNSHFFSIHQLSSMPTSRSTSEPWRDMLFTRPPTREVHILTGPIPIESYLLNWKLAADIQVTSKIMPDYQKVVNPQGVTLGEVMDAAELGNRGEPFAVILGQAEDAEIENARREFRDVLRRNRKMRDLAVLRHAHVTYNDW